MKLQVLAGAAALALIAGGASAATHKHHAAAAGSYAAPSQPIAYAKLDSYLKASPAKRAKEAEMAAIAEDPTLAPISVCYNKLASAPDQVLAIARQECGKNVPPRLVEQRWDLTSCPLLTPIRATFKCANH